MIYIFDDRAQRRKDNEEKLRGFSNLVTFKIVTIIPGKPVIDSLFDSIENPECIIFHKSYALGDENVSFETIRQLFLDLGIPIVIFSGGTEGNHKHANEININADLMYNNLPFFLENRKENGCINIDTLLWGKKFRLNSLLEFQNNLAERYFINNDLNEPIDDIDEVNGYVEDMCPTTSEANLSDIITSVIEASPQMTWKELSEIIDQNIYKIQ